MKINEQVRSRSITSKASSACKINMGLVAGASDVQNSKGFVDYGSIIEKKMEGGGGGLSSDDVKLNPIDSGEGDSGTDNNPPKPTE